MPKLTPETKTRVAIYIRVSTLHQIDKDSLPMQRQDLIAYTKLMLNTDDYVIFEDAGYSGKNTDRPKFQKMMSQIRQGLFTHILAWKIDRISRNLLDFATMYNELKELGVIFVSKNEQFDTSSAMGEAMLKIILIFAELERNMTAERVTATMISRASNGQWNGGRVPYGYDYNSETAQFSFNEEEAPIVTLIHNIYEQERSLIKEARILNNKGYRSRAGNEWSPVSLHIILHNTFYCGDYQYNRLKEGNRQKVKKESEWISIKNHHPAIISREQKERIIALLDNNRKLRKERNVYASTKHIHILGGLLFCSDCKRLLTCTPASKNRYGIELTRYTCPAKRKADVFCDNPSVTDLPIGEFIFNYILNLLNAQQNFKSISSPKELQAKLLQGNTFNYIAEIEEYGLNDLYNILISGKIKDEIYGKSVKFNSKKLQADSELTKLHYEKRKLERALDRLTNLYLYSENNISEQEYITQKIKLTQSIEEVQEQIGFASDPWQQSISDEEFIQKASEFIISQKLTNRNYINYQRLAMSVDAEILKSFVHNIIERIIVKNGKVTCIIFKNGLAHSFLLKN